MRIAATLFALFLLAVSGVFLALAMMLPDGARIVPLSVAAPLCVLLATQVARELRLSGAPSGTRGPGGSAEPGGMAPAAGAEAAAIGWVLGLAVLLMTTGIVAGPAVFVVLYLRRRAGMAWQAAALTGATTALLSWLVISRVIGAPVTGGLAGTILGL